jgi:hypothetical protein
VRRLLLLAAVAVTAAACTERLTTPGGCPALCPGGEPAVRDTVIDALTGRDSSFSGYTNFTEATSFPLSTGGVLGDSRAVIRFIRRGDSVTVGTVSYQLAIDSIIVRVVLQERDTTASNLQLAVYRLPGTVDSTISFAELDGMLTEANRLRTVSIVDSARAGPYNLLFTGAELAKFAFTEADSSRLTIALKLIGPGPGIGAYFGASRSGDAAPLFQTWGTIEVTDTAQQKQLLQRAVAQNFTVRPAPTSVTGDLLLVGGDPASRSLLRFALPDYLRDSATIIRATLELTPDRPIVGISGDSTRLDINALFADFGAKSVTLNSPASLTWIKPGSDVLRFEVTPLVRTWQGATPLPAALRIRHAFEWSSFMTPVFRSTRSASGAPRLRITYRPPFALEGF